MLPGGLMVEGSADGSGRALPGARSGTLVRCIEVGDGWWPWGRAAGRPRGGLDAPGDGGSSPPSPAALAAAQRCNTRASTRIMTRRSGRNRRARGKPRGGTSGIIERKVRTLLKERIRRHLRGQALKERERHADGGLEATTQSNILRRVRVAVRGVLEREVVLPVRRRSVIQLELLNPPE